MLWKSGPIPNLPVYVVCPRDGEGCSQTLHRNYLLPISSNMEQDETDGSEDRVENNTSLTPVPSVSSSTQSSPDQPAPVRWHLDHQGATSLEVSKFWVVNRYQTNRHPGCKGRSVCLFVYLDLAI